MMATYLYNLPGLGPTPLDNPMTLEATFFFLLGHPDFFLFGFIPLFLLGWAPLLMTMAGVQDPQVQLAGFTSIFVYLTVIGIPCAIRLVSGLLSACAKQIGNILKLLLGLVALVPSVPIYDCYYHSTYCEWAEPAYWFYGILGGLLLLRALAKLADRPPRPYTHPLAKVVASEHQNVEREFAREMSRMRNEDARLTSLFTKLPPATQEHWRARYEERLQAVKRMRGFVQKQTDVLQEEIGLANDVSHRESLRRARSNA